MSEGSTDRKRLSFETVGSVSAILIGAIALFVAWDQARVMRKQQHASVWPILTIDRSFDYPDQTVLFEIQIKNAGVGPALLKSASLHYNDEELTSWTDVLDLLSEEDRSNRQIRNTSIAGRALAPGDGFRPFGVGWENHAEPYTFLAALNEQFDGLALEVCYCSVFDRCWVASSSVSVHPTQVKSCPIDSDGIE